MLLTLTDRGQLGSLWSRPAAGLGEQLDLTGRDLMSFRPGFTDHVYLGRAVARGGGVVAADGGSQPEIRIVDRSKL